MPMMSQREEKGYKVIGINGVLDSDIYREHLEERSLLDDFRAYVLRIGDNPLVIDTRGCRFRGRDSLGLFTEAYRLLQRRIPVIYDDDRLAELLKRTGIGCFIELYRTADDLPIIISSR